MPNKAKNINFSIDEGAVEFTFNDNENAYLQLPDTGDSQHQINGLDENEWEDKERDIFKQLSDFYFKSFTDTECAAASVETGCIIEHIEEILYKNIIIYVAFDEDGEEHLLVESPYKDYYNKKALFEMFYPEMLGEEMYDFSESEIIKKARKAYSKK